MTQTTAQPTGGQHESVGQRIRRLRKLRGLTIEELAGLTQSSMGYISELENNPKRSPSLKKLRAFAEALEVDEGALLAQGNQADVPRDHGLVHPEPEEMICAGGLFLALLAAAYSPAHADIAGVASVIDADTIEIHGERIRLHGIDAPESSQTCLDLAGREWRCGQAAALALQDLIGRRTVTCDERDVDRYARIVGRCTVGGIDINRWLVEQGLAIAYRRYSRDYVAAEDKAREARRGMWAGTFEPPWGRLNWPASS